MSDNRDALLWAIELLAVKASNGVGELEALRAELETNKVSNNYWIGEYNKANKRIKELEAEVANLRSPLADLARAAAKENE
jgi:cell division protein FtsB